MDRGPHRFFVDRISILYYTKSSYVSLSFLLSFLPPSSFVLAPLSILTAVVSPRRGESSGEKGWRVLRKGGADFGPRVCLCERPLAGHPISPFRMAGINRREMERNGPIRGSTGVLSSPGNFRTSAGIIDSLADPRILVALNYLNCIHRTRATLSN